MALTGNLIGQRFGNTALYVEQDNRSDAYLFDCGYLRDLSEKELLRVRTLCVSHTHIDHFIDFDYWLAAWIRRGRTDPGPTRLTCFGPPGFNRNLEGKLMGFLWNLIDFDLTIISTEIDTDADREQRKTVHFNSADRFAPGSTTICEYPAKRPGAAGNLIEPLWQDDRLEIHAITVDHGTPCLGYAVLEKTVQVIDKDALKTKNYPPGPWLKSLKDAIVEGAPGSTEIETPHGVEKLEILSRTLLQTKPGQKIAFITDTIYNKKTAPAIENLVRGADTLFIETAFLHADLDKARENFHLTARQAGRIARDAKVANLIPFHFSPRYQDREKELLLEAQETMTR